MTMTTQAYADVSVSGAVAPPGAGSGSAGAAFRRMLLSEEVIDGLLADVADGDGRGLRLTGDGGFLPQLVKAVLERGLSVELADHLGYAKGDPAGRSVPNSRNGSTPKTLVTEVGQVPVDVPRDRAGTFTPALVPKGVRRIGGGLDDMIISLYAGGMTVRDIEHHLARTLGTEVSPDTISKITDGVLEEVKAWQHRPLDPVYPVVFFDALVVKVRAGNVVTNKAAHIAVGVDTDGIKHVLGIWVQSSEGATFWAQV
jgi:putative transposase